MSPTQSLMPHTLTCTLTEFSSVLNILIPSFPHSFIKMWAAVRNVSPKSIKISKGYLLNIIRKIITDFYIFSELYFCCQTVIYIFILFPYFHNNNFSHFPDGSEEFEKQKQSLSVDATKYE